MTEELLEKIFENIEKLASEGDIKFGDFTFKVQDGKIVSYDVTTKHKRRPKSEPNKKK